jgi:hypothetical protein
MNVSHTTATHIATPPSAIRGGPWQITDTVLSDRKNLFCMNPDKAFHIATIVSGSKSQISRFEESLVLMRAAPEMYQVLEGALAVIRSVDTASAELVSVASKIEMTLARASSSFSEG